MTRLFLTVVVVVVVVVFDVVFVVIVVVVAVVVIVVAVAATKNESVVDPPSGRLPCAGGVDFDPLPSQASPDELPRDDDVGLDAGVDQLHRQVDGRVAALVDDDRLDDGEEVFVHDEVVQAALGVVRPFETAVQRRHAEQTPAVGLEERNR